MLVYFMPDQTTSQTSSHDVPASVADSIPHFSRPDHRKHQRSLAQELVLEHGVVALLWVPLAQAVLLVLALALELAALPRADSSCALPPHAHRCQNRPYPCPWPAST